MPTYDYVCNACGREFEQFQSITAKSLRKCPKCGKLKLRRLIGTGAGVIFKGSGFYETDYRTESYKKGAKKESDGVKKAKEGAESKDKASGAKKKTEGGASSSGGDKAGASASGASRGGRGKGRGQKG